jgi:WavE lipopolysaccharide synthesis
MIALNDISVVLQGNFRANTLEVLRGIRETAPGAHIVFSTFENAVSVEQRQLLHNLVDEWVWSEDPGAMPATVWSTTAPCNNINRMLQTTTAGLARVRTPYALKLRSDAQVDVRAIAELWWQQSRGDADQRRVLFPSLYTRHPHGINGYLFHVSDWLGFGTTERLREYWRAPVFGDEEARWFETHAHRRFSTATARRFRARLTQEQWIACDYARRQGYQVPQFVNDRSRTLLASYRKFLARECVIVDSAQIGLLVPGHRHAQRSAFQSLDCTSHKAWRQLLAPAGEVRPAPIEPLRLLARSSRHAIARGILIRKWFKSKLNRQCPPSPEIQEFKSLC